MMSMELSAKLCAWDAGSEGRAILDAHDDYHWMGSTSRASFDEMSELGHILSRSPAADHQIDAGWAYVSAALLQPTHDAAPSCLNGAKRSWQIAEQLSESPSERVKARLNQAYLPSYQEFITTGMIDRNKLLHRLINLNRHTVAEDRKRPNRINGIAAELATLTILTRQAVKQRNHDIAWPSTSWQDQQYGHRRSNYDISYGRFPYGIYNRIQVKSQLGQSDLPNILKTEDGDTLLEYWRQRYEPSIILLFGDVHLGNTMGNRLSANKLLADPPSASRNQQLDILTSNILSEIDSYDNRHSTTCVKSLGRSALTV